MLDNAHHTSRSLSQPTYEGCTLPSIQLILKGGKLSCLTEGKCTHEWTGYCNQNLLSLEVVAVLMLIHPCSALSGGIVDTKRDEYKSNFIFIIGAGMSG